MSSNDRKKSSGNGKPELVTVEEQEEFLRVIKQLNLVSAPAPIATNAIEQPKEHKFWQTQPVPQIDDFSQEHGAIDAPKTVADVRQEPYAMPAGFVWCDVDFSDATHAQEVYDLLTHNYVEDDDNMFRFDYSVAFLAWALTPPGYYKDWHIGVRNATSNKLLAIISAIPVTTRVYDNTMAMAEVNFLCIHKKLRAKRLAPVLIKEVTRKVNLRNIWQAVYTAGVTLPMPVATCQYFHRSLNPKKLVDVGFSRLPPRTTMTQTIKRFALPRAPRTPGFRAMEERDVAAVTTLLQTYLQSFDLVPVYNEADVAHWLLPRAGVISSYVVEDATTHNITDFCSFYHLPSTIIGNAKYKTLHAAYAFYNVATSVSLSQLMQDALIVAKHECDMDVFNALTLMDNDAFLHELQFGAGDGDLLYYLYNWRCPRMASNRVGTVLC